MPNLWKDSFKGLQQFEFDLTNNQKLLNFNLNTDNSRLGKLAEKLFSIWVSNHHDWELVFENLQIIEHKRTLGELDFCLKNKKNNQYYHIELVTKFYLFNPVYSCNDINAWIGPNRNDSLFKKITKLKDKQLPLLQHRTTSTYLKEYKLTSETIQQFVCFKAWLFVPLDFKETIINFNTKCIGGWYMDFKAFTNFKKDHFLFKCPQKQDWLLKPESEKSWFTFSEVTPQINKFIEASQAIMVWIKNNGNFNRVVIVPYKKI